MKRILSLFVSALCAVGAWAEEPLSYEYVDLGLSVKWATCNLGATSSTAAGWYLAWGETAPKTNYTWETYLSGLGGTMTEWQDAGTEKDPLKEYVKGGANYSEGIGGTAYDAATAALGAGYRMPTHTEFAELANTDNCSWVWYDKDNTEFNGVAGYKVTSKKDGYTDKYIFLPAAGYRNGESPYREGSYGLYWSSTPDPDDADYACNLYSSSDNVYPYSADNRHLGVPVRPVYDGPDPIAQITIDGATTDYTDVDGLLSAFEAINGKATVTLLGDIFLPDEKNISNQESDADITLDLNGHNIKGNKEYDGIFDAYQESKITVLGDGIVENIAENSAAFGCGGYSSSIVVNGGTYKTETFVCFVESYCIMTINGGKFKAPVLYYEEEGYSIKPIVKGGIFSMDPSDCVAEGYAAVPNDDEDTKADYPYKVVEKPLTPTAIDAVNADKAGKAIKTIENGKVVIIRNGEKFDLAGRKL